jgi:hypothetical protein
MSNRIFSARMVVLLAALAVFLFSLTILLSAYEDPMTRSDARAGAFSTASLGYAGLYDVLERLGRRVEKSVDGDGNRGTGLLVLAEPGARELRRAAEALTKPPPRTLLVLPKWKPIGNPARSKWIVGVEGLRASEAAELLNVAAIPAAVVRQPWPENWQTNELGFAPTGNNLVQLLRSDAFRPVVGGESGMLVGEWRSEDGEKAMWVLSDPDVMANHGIGLGDNAAFMLALFRAMGNAGVDMPIIFDESMHGYSPRQSSPLRLLFEFPLVIVTVIAVLSALLLVLAGAQRFGDPVRARRRLGFGKESLIDNSARLMAYAGHEYPVLRRYVFMQMHAVAEALHAPAGLDNADLAEWLDKHARSSAPDLACGEILGRTLSLRGEAGGHSGAMACAADIHRWRESIL